MPAAGDSRWLLHHLLVFVRANSLAGGDLKTTWDTSLQLLWNHAMCRVLNLKHCIQTCKFACGFGGQIKTSRGITRDLRDPCDSSARMESLQLKLQSPVLQSYRLHILRRRQAQLTPIILADLSAQLVQACHCHEGIHCHQVVVHLRT